MSKSTSISRARAASLEGLRFCSNQAFELQQGIQECAKLVQAWSEQKLSCKGGPSIPTANRNQSLHCLKTDTLEVYFKTPLLVCCLGRKNLVAVNSSLTWGHRMAVQINCPYWHSNPATAECLISKITSKSRFLLLLKEGLLSSEDFKIGEGWDVRVQKPWQRPELESDAGLTSTALMRGSAAFPTLARAKPKSKEIVIMPRMFMSTAATAMLSGKMLRNTLNKASRAEITVYAFFASKGWWSENWL